MATQTISVMQMEETDTERRKKNIIIYRIPEKKMDDVEERKHSDATFVKDFLDLPDKVTR